RSETRNLTRNPVLDKTVCRNCPIVWAAWATSCIVEFTLRTKAYNNFDVIIVMRRLSASRCTQYGFGLDDVPTRGSDALGSLPAVFLTGSGLRKVGIVFLDQVILVAMTELTRQRIVVGGMLPSRFRAAIFYRTFAHGFIGLAHHRILRASAFG